MNYSKDMIYNILSFLPYNQIFPIMWIFRNTNNVEKYIIYDLYKEQISNLNRRYCSHVVSYNYNNICYTIVDGYINEVGYIKFNNLDKVNFMLHVFSDKFILKFYFNKDNLTFIQNMVIKFMEQNIKNDIVIL